MEFATSKSSNLLLVNKHVNSRSRGQEIAVPGGWETHLPHSYRYDLIFGQFAASIRELVIHLQEQQNISKTVFGFEFLGNVKKNRFFLKKVHTRAYNKDTHY